MTIYTQSALLAAIVTLALAIGMLIRGRRTALHYYYVLLNFVLFAWNVGNFLSSVTQSELWSRVSTIVALFVPFSALKFFHTFLDDQDGLAERVSRITGITTLMLIPFVVSPLWRQEWFSAVLFIYVFVNLYLCMFFIWKKLRSSDRRTESARLLYLAIGGVVAITFTLLGFIPRLGFPSAMATIPVLGNVMIAFYMYFLSQILVQYRLLGLSELVGKIAVLAALVLLLTAIYGLLAIWIGDNPGQFSFYTLVVAFVLLILFEPMKVFIEERINRILFRERFEFTRQLALLRRELANVVEIDDLAELLIARLQNSRRVTRASLYLLEDDGLRYRRIASLEDAPAQLDAVKNRHFFEQLKEEGAIVLEDIQDQINTRRQEDGAEAEVEDLNQIAQVLRHISASVSLPILSEERVIGLINVNDDRMREAYTVEEVRLLVQIASQAAISIENSRASQALREKDRLAAVGEMAAGLAHEIRNPLGAIKGAAQFLELEVEQLADETPEEDSPAMFLEIIIEEVNRLNSVVSQFLDYARPYRGEPEACDINRAVERAASLWKHQCELWEVELVLDLAEGLPLVQADVEQLKQIFLNLVINAIQATGTPPREEDEPESSFVSSTEIPARGSGAREAKLIVRTGLANRVRGPGGRLQAGEMVAVQFIDNGGGIPTEELDRIFIPFFTTKQKGSGLGLAISQRILENLGGQMEVSSEVGRGSTFRLLLPLWEQSSRSGVTPPVS